MFSKKEDKSLFNTVSYWIAKGKYDTVKFLLEDTVPTDLAGENNVTLLHLAAQNGNPHITEHLINIGYEVDAKNFSNQTPLLLAVTYRHWEAATFLLKHNADIFARDAEGATPLSELMCSNKPNLEVLQIFFDKVKSRSADKKEFVAMLSEAGCELNMIIHLHDAEVTQMFLDMPGTDASEEQLTGSSIDIAMRTIDEENMRVLLHHSKGQALRREDFMSCIENVLFDRYNDESLTDVLRVALEQIVKWKLLNDTTVHFIELIFYEAPELCLRGAMSDSLVSYIKDEFNYDIRVHVFGSCSPWVLEMVQNGEADMNALSRKGRTALHVAASRGAIDSLKYLLDCGANPNARDENGRTPIFDVELILGGPDKECFIRLLQYGADLQATDNLGNTCINYDSSDFSYNSTKIFVAHLAILETSGVPLNESSRNCVFSSDKSRNYFRSCCQQLENMKTHKVHSSLALFETLTENLGNLTRRVRSIDHETIETFFRSKTVRKYDSYYTSTLRKRLKKAVTINNLRAKAATVISDSIEALKPYYVVINKICSFLSYYDLRLFK